jgi:hypothetical protein
MDAPGYERGSRRKARVVVSRGRGQPCTQQGMIVGTVDFPRTAYDDRKLSQPTRADIGSKKRKAVTDIQTWQEANQVIAPLGDPICFQAMQGEIAIAAVDEFGVTERNPLSIDAQLSVTTTVNGWPIEKDAMFAGVVRNARPLTSQDDKGTIAYVGTQTVLNTGPYEIMPGDDVYFSLTPHMTVDNGHVSNAIEIDEAGQPGHHGILNEEGEHNAKFKPALYPLRDNSIYAYLRKGVILIEGWFFQKGLDLYDPSWNDACWNFINLNYTCHSSDMPALSYFRLVIAEKSLMFIVRDISSLSPADNHAKFESLESFSSLYFNETQNKRKKYLEAIGLNDRNTTSSKIFTPQTLVTATTNAHITPLCASLQCRYQQGKLELVCEQHNWMRRHLIGKCIKGNAPGSGIDIACGYGHH